MISRERRSSGARAGAPGFVLVGVAGVAGGGHAFFAPCLYKKMTGQLWARGKHISTASIGLLLVSFCHITYRGRGSSRVGARVAGFVLVKVVGVAGGGAPFSPPRLYKNKTGQLRARGKHISTAARDSLSVSFCHTTCREKRSSRAGAGVAGFVLV